MTRHHRRKDVQPRILNLLTSVVHVESETGTFLGQFHGLHLRRGGDAILGRRE